MAKEIRDKSDVVCNFYQSAEDVHDTGELSPEKRIYWYFMISYLKTKIPVYRITSEEDTATLIASI